ncbi:Mth938-like domain-containing protein [Microbaculum marinum]|uniref:MTH938/NDUFAF3 family protein n=1 Tax=Microbaculum marinum TaxID=1764581 RepID=A0AAW9RWN0_9HYPH
MRDAHFPGRAPIEAYGNGGFRFAGMSHRGSILILLNAIYAWPVSEPGQIGVEALSRAMAADDRPELLLIGTGRQLVPAAPDLRDAVRDHGIRIETMDTGAAVRTYNVLLAEERSVGAALIAVD